MALAVRLYKTTQTITGLPSGIPVTFHLMGAGQAGFGGVRSNGGTPVGGVGGAGAYWASVVSTPAPGDVYTITIGAGGVAPGGAGGDTILRKNAVIICRAPGGASVSAPIGISSNAGGVGGDPSVIGIAPPGMYLQAAYGGGGGGCGGPDGVGGNGANQADYMTPLNSPSFGYWSFNTLLFPGLYAQTISGSAPILPSFGGGGASNGAFPQTPSIVDAPVLTNVGQSIYAGNGGGIWLQNRSAFFTVRGRGADNAGACASQDELSNNRADPSVFAPGGNGTYFCAINNAGTPFRAGAVVIGIDPSVPFNDALGPGTGAGACYGIVAPIGSGFLPTHWDLSGFDGGSVGAGGSGGSSMWDFDGGYTLTSVGGAGAIGGAAAVWTLPASPINRIHAKLFPPIPLVVPHYVIDP